MSQIQTRALLAIIAAAVIAGAVYFTPLGGPFSPHARHLAHWAEGGFKLMNECIAEQGADCTVPREINGALAFDAGGRFNPACLAATYAPGGAHSFNIHLAPTGCYIGASNGEFCFVVKETGDATHCIDSAGRNSRNQYCLATGVCTGD